jgi:hypothetical protein
MYQIACSVPLYDDMFSRSVAWHCGKPRDSIEKWPWQVLIAMADINCESE